MRKLTLSALPLLVALLLGAAACSSASKKAATSATSATSGGGLYGGNTASSAPSSSAAGVSSSTATVSVAHNAKLGDFLVAADGRTLYLFEADKGLVTACTGPCVSAWPALTSTSPTAGTGVDKSKLSTATGAAADQVVYNGHLLYEYAGDKKAGDTNGTAIPQWYAVSPKGEAIEVH